VKDHAKKSITNLSDFACYGCMKILQECKEETLLPNFIDKRATKLSTQMQLREQVKEFLLED